MTRYGILVDNKYCTGCHTCEIACKNERGLPKGQWGIKLLELGPWELPDNTHWEWRYVPVLTKNCDLCTDRVKREGLPSCVFHCPAEALKYGPLDELAKSLDKLEEMGMIVIP